MNHIIDKFLNLTISKTLSVVAMATILQYSGNLSPEWVVVAGVYIGGQKWNDIKNLYKK